ncbi:N-acetyltransferase, partial [Jiangella anatolica]
GRAGEPLEDAGGGRWRCPRTKELYLEQDGRLIEAGPATEEA